MLVGAVLYCVIAGISWGLSCVTVYLQDHNAPQHICTVTYWLAEFLFAVDVLCFVIFVVIECYTLIRLMVRNARDHGEGGNHV